MKKNRDYYNDLFKDYPDLVTLEQFREMLGAVGNSTARVLSDHYMAFKKRLKLFYLTFADCLKQIIGFSMKETNKYAKI